MGHLTNIQRVLWEKTRNNIAAKLKARAFLVGQQKPQKTRAPSRSPVLPHKLAINLADINALVAAMRLRSPGAKPKKRSPVVKPKKRSPKVKPRRLPSSMMMLV